jgi:CheY-like chemotaxis protein
LQKDWTNLQAQNSSLKIPQVPKEWKIVLIVERDPFYRSYIQEFLRKARLEQEFVLDGVSALKRIQMRKPDLFITEAVLPKVDGLTLCRHVRSEVADLPIIVFSVLELEEEALAAGADLFLLKPYSEKAFSEAISRFLPIAEKEKEQE